jgi:two-component system, cell cycle response regulator
MSSGLVEQLHEVPLDRENQDLKEIIEIAFQITAQLEIENIIKNVVWSFVSRFQCETVIVVLPADSDEDAGHVVSYRGLKKEDLGLALPALHPLLAFLDKDEYNQVPFNYLRESFPDKEIVDRLAALSVDIVVPLRTDKGAMGILLLPRSGSGEPYGLLELQYITRIARFASISLENANLFRQATTDRMTGLYSHHFFEKSLDEEIERSRRYKSTFTLVMFDIDHFKVFNDTYGHLQGDRIIREIARIMRKAIRQVDFAARYGGEEFALILPAVDVKGALVVAERLRKRVETFGFPSANGGEPLSVTISLGVAEFDPESSYAPSEIIREADRALYQSKENGRNRVTVSSPRPT